MIEILNYVCLRKLKYEYIMPCSSLSVKFVSGSFVDNGVI